MATITTITDALREETRKSINTADADTPYRTDPTEVYEGLKAIADIQSFPVICFDLGEEEITEYFGDAGHGVARIIIYGYSQTDNVDNRSTIRDLAHDVLYFLFNDFSYAGQILTFSSIEYFPGMTGKPAGFLFDFEIKYDFTNIDI